MVRKKKGSLLDVGFIGIIALVIVIVGAITTTFVRTLDDPDINLFNATPEGQSMYNTYNSFYRVLDFAAVSAWVFLLIATAILAYLLRSHPFFMVFGVFILAFMVLLSVGVVKIYEAFATDAVIGGVVQELSLFAWFINYLPLFTAGGGFLIMFVMYALGGDE